MGYSRVVKYGFCAAVIGILIANMAMTGLLLQRVRTDRNSLQQLDQDMQIIKQKLETEIQLRQDLFPQLKKSARLLQKYNPRLDFATALRYASKIYECSDSKVSFEILTALIVVESSANYRAVSSKGALGLTQVMPNIWKCDRTVLIDPYKNIEIGSSILRHYVGRHGLMGGLSAYNSGKKNASLRYARKVVRIASLHF
ncbi:transglycosylase SLT domain-containing protein [Thermodesulfobacteriota bacterium]